MNVSFKFDNKSIAQWTSFLPFLELNVADTWKRSEIDRPLTKEENSSSHVIGMKLGMNSLAWISHVQLSPGKSN